MAVLLPARASKVLLKKGEKCHQVLCRGCGAAERRKNVEWVGKRGEKKEREKREGRDSHVERTRKRIDGGKGATEEDRRWRRKVGDL